MKILWLSHFVPWPSTGHGALARSFHLVREAARRHELHLVALAPPAADGNHDEAALASARAALREYCASAELIPIERRAGRARRALLAARSWPSPHAYWEHWYWSQDGADAFTATQRRTEPALVHLDTIFLRRYAPLVRGRFVLNHHNVESHLLERRNQSASVAGRLFFGSQATKVRRAEQSLARRAESNIMVSQTDVERLRRVVPEARASVIANGVDLDFFSLPPVLEANPRELVFLGGMDWFPNRDAIDWFVTDIWPRLSGPGGVERATIVGRSPSPLLVQGAAADPHLVAAGFVDDVRPFVSRAAIFICPMRVGGGTRLKILDALAMGRVLVSTAVGVEGIPVVDGEHYLRAETPDEFVAQVARASGDPAMRDRLSRAGRALVEREFGWTHLGDRLHEVYCAAADGH